MGNGRSVIDVELLPGVVKMVLCIPSMYLLCVTMLLVIGYMSQTGMEVLSQLGYLLCLCYAEFAHCDHCVYGNLHIALLKMYARSETMMSWAYMKC